MTFYYSELKNLCVSVLINRRPARIYLQSARVVDDAATAVVAAAASVNRRRTDQYLEERVSEERLGDVERMSRS